MNIYTHISELRKMILAKDMQGTFRVCNTAGLNKNQHPYARAGRSAETSRLQAC